MNSKRLYYIMLAAVCLLVIGLIGGAYGASSFLQTQSQTVIKARSKAAALEQQQTQLAKAKASIVKYQSVGNIAKSVVPQDKDQAQAVREIVKIAGANGISLGTLTFPTSTLGAGMAAATAAGGAAPAPTAASAAEANLSQLKPALGISGVYTLQITVQSDATKPIPFNKFVDFLAGLEGNRRTALVSAVSLQPDAKDPSLVSFTITVDEYIKP